MIVAADYLILCLLALPLLASFLALVMKPKNLRDAALVLVALTLLGVVAKIVLHYDQLKYDLVFTVIPLMSGVAVEFTVEPLGLIFALILGTLWGVTMLYTIGYMRHNKQEHQSRFYCFFSLSIFAALGIALASNLLTLFVFYELLTLSTYPLVTHAGNEEAKEGGRSYLFILMGTSVLFLLPAIIITYHLTGTLAFTSGGILHDRLTPVMTVLLLALYIFGIGKAAIMPFHRWLPAAMVAPTPVSALLHAVAVVKAGVFCVLKILIYIFGVDYLHDLVALKPISLRWFMYLAGFTVIAASVIAMRQDVFKRRLAYSTVSQLSYILLAASLFTPKGMMAAMLHMVVHAFGKITLFFTAGAIYTASKKRRVSEFAGIGKKMPLTMAFFSIAALSMVAIPPVAGFLSKWYIMESAFDEKAFFVVIVLCVSTLLNAAYFLPIAYQAYLGKPAKTGKKHGEAPVMMLIAMGITASICVLLFFAPSLVLDIINMMIFG